MSIIEKTQKIQVMGSSHGIVIPKDWLQILNLKKGDTVSLTLLLFQGNKKNYIQIRGN